MTNLISTYQHEATLELTFRRPEKRNALNAALAEAALDAFRVAQADESVRVIVLRGEGGTLSSGADLSNQDEFAASKRDYASDPRAVLVKEIYSSATPVIAVIDGYAIGLGMGLAGAATFAVSTTESAFGMPEAAMGFFPFGVVPYLVDRVASHTVLEWALTGARVSAADAHGSGLVTHLVGPDDLQPTVDTLAAALGKAPRSVTLGGMRFHGKVRARIAAGALIEWSERAIGTDG